MPGVSAALREIAKDRGSALRHAGRRGARRLEAAQSAALAESGPSLVVATYNVHACVGTDRRYDPARIAAVLRELGADIISLQEVGGQRHGGQLPDQAAFLAAETGRRQWELYEHNDAFMLTIMISDEDKHGAGTSKYVWDDNGKLIAATIVLGSRINEGYPNPIYYPVMNALAPDASAAMVKNNVLAAAKIAHEFGHVKQVASMNGATYRLQNELIPLYNEILLKNGRNTKDPRLVELAAKMGGTPVEIWEDREYWGEANAMLFLRDRIAKEKFHCRLFGKIKQIVDVLISRSMKQGLDPLAFDISKEPYPSGKVTRMEVPVRNGLKQEDAKKVTKLIKDSGLKVQAQIMDDLVRVTAKKIDDLQAIIKLSGEANLGIALQFVNMRS